MTNPDPFQEDQAEEAAERQAYALLHHASSFTQCLQQQEIAPCLPVIDQKGNEITLHGKSVYDTRTWRKFLRAQPEEIVPLSLTEQTKPLSEAYATWLRTTMTIPPQDQGKNPPAGGTGWLVSNYGLDLPSDNALQIVQPA